jgi:Ras-related protein Rab-1A
VTSQESFDHVEAWLEEINQHSSSKAVKILLANKVDLADQRKVTKQDVQALTSRLDILSVETSAKAATNIQKAFEEITREMLKKGQGDNSGVPRVKPGAGQSPSGGPTAEAKCCA